MSISIPFLNILKDAKILFFSICVDSTEKLHWLHYKVLYPHKKTNFCVRSHFKGTYTIHIHSNLDFFVNFQSNEENNQGKSEKFTSQVILLPALLSLF